MRTFWTLLVPLAFLFGVDRCGAAEGDPIAIIRLPGGGVAIETIWNFSVVITDSSDDLTSQLPGVDMLLGEAVDGLEHDGPRVMVDASKSIDHVLDRPANQEQPTFDAYSGTGKFSPNAVRIRTLASAILVEVDGVRIVYLASPVLSGLPAGDEGRAMMGCDALIIGGGGDTTTNSKNIAQTMRAKRLIVRSQRQTDDARLVLGNTIAVSAAKQPESLQVLTLNSTPVELADELTELIARKEQACKASQQVFAELSIPQLNFRPSNGSHTPRWNAEHMMGRELLFFSQIYHSQDDAIGVVDLNPKQMPPDYIAKHPDWKGSEEAQQMERVSAFTRRFAYLLKDLPLDRKAPGSGWTPRALLKQMERHYNDHTANVKKKFLLPDWPKN